MLILTMYNHFLFAKLWFLFEKYVFHLNFRPLHAARSNYHLLVCVVGGWGFVTTSCNISSVADKPYIAEDSQGFPSDNGDGI
jgi:hypothetical protein